MTLFIFCFSTVHLARLARLGWKYGRTLEKTEKEKTEEKAEEAKKTAPANPSQEPIYYIVERKRQRPKTHYEEPKQIRFQNTDSNSNAS